MDKARARETGGSGLGLSIAQELADLNDISIDVTSRVNVGTTFNLSIKKVKKNEETE